MPITLPITHPFMMKNDKVIEQVIYYLEFGEFLKTELLKTNFSKIKN